MKIWHSLIFDERISGTGPFYTSDRFCDALGSWAFNLSVLAAETSGTSPALTIQAQHSPDKLSWLDSVIMVNNDLLSNGPMWLVYHDGSAAYVRLKISLSGTAPATSLKLWATARCELRIFDCATQKQADATQSCGCK